MIHLHSRIQEKIVEDLGTDLLMALTNPNIIEIMLNSDGNVWVDTFDGMQFYCTYDNQKARNLINTIATLEQKEINPDNPRISTELRIQIQNEFKKFRFQGGIPPIVENPMFTIRKPASRVINLDEILEQEFINKDQYDYINEAIKNRKSFLIAGETGSGKTTFCNGLIDQMGKYFPDKRVIIIEDTLELRCSVKNKERLRTSPNVTMNQLLQDCLRLRPDTIIVGEVRGKEAHTLIKAWNTGHQGGICTIHANTAESVLERLEELIKEDNTIPSKQGIVEAINIIIYLEKTNLTKVKRRVKEIIELEKYDKGKNCYVYKRFC